MHEMNRGHDSKARIFTGYGNLYNGPAYFVKQTFRTGCDDFFGQQLNARHGHSVRQFADEVGRQAKFLNGVDIDNDSGVVHALLLQFRPCRDFYMYGNRHGPFLRSG